MGKNQSWKFQMKISGYFSELNSYFHDGLAVVKNSKGTYDYIDKTGKKVCGGFEYADSFSEGLAAVKNSEGTWDYIDKTGKKVCGGFNSADFFSDGLASVINSEWTCDYIDKTGKKVLGGFKYAGNFSDGLAPVKNSEGTWDYIDKTGKKVLGGFKWAGAFDRGLASVENSEGTRYYINKTGKKVFFEDEYPFRDGDIKDLNPVKNSEGTYDYIDKTDKKVFGGFERACDFSDGLALVENSEGTWEYINEEGLYLVDGSKEENYFDAIREDLRYIKMMPDDLFKESQEKIVECIRTHCKDFYLENISANAIEKQVASKLQQGSELIQEKRAEIKENEKQEREAAEKTRILSMIENFDIGGKGGEDGREK